MIQCQLYSVIMGCEGLSSPESEWTYILCYPKRQEDTFISDIEAFWTTLEFIWYI